MKLAILTSHPIQYQAPLFRYLAQQLDLIVLFAHRQSAQGQADAGFGVAFEWDTDLLSGYTHHFLNNVSSTPGTGSFFGCNTPEIAARLKAENIDVLLVTGWNLLSYWQAIMACRRIRVPVMVRGDSHMNTPRSLIKRLVKHILYPQLLGYFDRFLYVGQNSKHYYRHFGVPENKLFFSPHCIDNTAFNHMAASANADLLKKELGLTSVNPVVIFAGKLLPAKNPDILLEALLMMKNKGQTIQCVFVGDGPLRTTLQNKSEEYGLTVRFAGFRNQSQLPAFYAMADLLVLPSSGHETWGLVVNEALASGTRVVVADSVGCANDLVIDGITGSIFPEGNVAALVQAIEKLLNIDPDLVAIEEKISAYSIPSAASGILAAIADLNTAWESGTDSGI